MDGRLDRRGALFGLAAAGLASGWAVPVVAAPADGETLPLWAPRVLSTREARTLAAACEAILPATDTPGAIGAGVPQFIDRTLADWSEPADVARLRAGLARMDADAKTAFGSAFAGLNDAQQASLLTTYDGEAAGQRPHFFTLLRDLTTTGYFTSEPGATKALRYDPAPGAYRGCVPLAEIGRAWAT